MHRGSDHGGGKIRTLHVVYRLDTRLGGAVHAALGVCKYLAQAGEPVEVAGSVGPGDELDYLRTEYPEFRTHMFVRSFPARYANSGEFARWLRQNLRHYDLVELHTVFSIFMWRAAQICRSAGKPYLMRPHGSLDGFDLRKHALLKKVVGPLFVRPMLAGAAGAVLTAPLEAERLVTYGAKVRRIVLPLPVRLPSETGDGPAFRKRHRIPDGARVVLFMSRVDYKKGLQFLIPALGQLRKEIPGLWLVLAGTGEKNYISRVETLLDAHGMREITTKTGFVSGQEKLDALAAADVFALPSLNENFGIVVIEAMHAGVPMLISNEVYIHQEIGEAGAGLICEPAIESVVQHLRRLLSGAVDRRVMGERGRNLVAQRYQPHAATELLIDTYEDLLGRKNPLRHATAEEPFRT